MAKLTLTTITGGFASVSALNTNNTAIVAALENTLSRDGTTPNAMAADFDLNSYDLLNGAVGYFTAVQINGVSVVPGSTLTVPTAASVPNVPAGDIVATDVQSALNELDTEKLAIANNLSDVADAATARTNLDVYSTTESDAISDFIRRTYSGGSGSWTKPAGLKAIVVTVVGGGGGGGNVAASNRGAASGGGAGGFNQRYLDASSVSSSVSYSVGSGGAGGSAGTQTYFGSYAVGNGGNAGIAPSGASNTHGVTPGGSGGSATGAGGIPMTGEYGSHGIWSTDATYYCWAGGNGATSPFGGGGRGGYSTSASPTVNGTAAVAYGAGGGGAASLSVGGTGGSGGSGLIIVDEYY